ncbi:unnamed protein product [Bursaphelenchus okinawaensis]|uniref:Uncharacterized protein n=1 Tax=Bursaphelenchus okinawaensis TaxID=465554 RepID=A0A811JVE1_9BILA|nr:unnamed protein product [Bursaphelenchus okinawaensis]CAG9085739.1 unnamed protein product [Bursaphelenchus okinawaensis]
MSTTKGKQKISKVTGVHVPHFQPGRLVLAEYCGAHWPSVVDKDLHKKVRFVFLPYKKGDKPFTKARSVLIPITNAKQLEITESEEESAEFSLAFQIARYLFKIGPEASAPIIHHPLSREQYVTALCRKPIQYEFLGTKSVSALPLKNKDLEVATDLDLPEATLLRLQSNITGIMFKTFPKRSKKEVVVLDDTALLQDLENEKEKNSEAKDKRGRKPRQNVNEEADELENEAGFSGFEGTDYEVDLPEGTFEGGAIPTTFDAPVLTKFDADSQEQSTSQAPESGDAPLKRSQRIRDHRYDQLMSRFKPVKRPGHLKNIKLEAEEKFLGQKRKFPASEGSPVKKISRQISLNEKLFGNVKDPLSLEELQALDKTEVYLAVVPNKLCYGLWPILIEDVDLTTKMMTYRAFLTTPPAETIKYDQIYRFPVDLLEYFIEMAKNEASAELESALTQVKRTYELHNKYNNIKQRRLNEPEVGLEEMDLQEMKMEALSITESEVNGKRRKVNGFDFIDDIKQQLEEFVKYDEGSMAEGESKVQEEDLLSPILTPIHTDLHVQLRDLTSPTVTAHFEDIWSEKVTILERRRHTEFMRSIMESRQNVFARMLGAATPRLCHHLVGYGGQGLHRVQQPSQAGQQTAATGRAGESAQVLMKKYQMSEESVATCLNLCDKIAKLKEFRLSPDPKLTQELNSLMALHAPLMSKIEAATLSEAAEDLTNENIAPGELT